MTLGGRAAEEIVFSEITTGASNDLEKVTETAKQMVMRFGMSERLGPRVFGHDRSQPFLGREFGTEPDYSDEIAREIDDEIRRIVEEAHQTAKDILLDKKEQLDVISKILLERETIDAEEFVKLLEGAKPEEVFDDSDEEAEAPPAPEAEADKSAGREGPRPMPRAAAGICRRLRRDAGRRPLPQTASPAAMTCAHDENHGHRQRHPRLVLGRGALPRCRGGDRARPLAGGPGRRVGRRRRRVDPAGGRSGRCRGGAAADRARGRGARRRRVRGLDRHLEGRGRRGGARCRREDGQRRHRAAR